MGIDCIYSGVRLGRYCCLLSSTMEQKNALSEGRALVY
jgi:hypothetical protein